MRNSDESLSAQADKGINVPVGNALAGRRYEQERGVEKKRKKQMKSWE